MEIWCVQFHTLLFNIKTLAGQETTPNLKKNSRGFLKKAKRTYKLSPGIIHIFILGLHLEIVAIINKKHIVTAPSKRQLCITKP